MPDGQPQRFRFGGCQGWPIGPRLDGLLLLILKESGRIDRFMGKVLEGNGDAKLVLSVFSGVSLQTTHLWCVGDGVGKRSSEALAEALAVLADQDGSEAERRWLRVLRSQRAAFRKYRQAEPPGPAPKPGQLTPAPESQAFRATRLEHRRRWLETHPDERTAQDDADGL